METNKAFEVLKKAIAKAVSNGYQTEIGVTVSIGEYIYHNRGLYFQIIFNHDFAKAFWKGGHVDIFNGENPEIIDSWKFHLQQMVSEDEPLKYLEKFLEEK